MPLIHTNNTRLQYTTQPILIEPNCRRRTWRWCSTGGDRPFATAHTPLRAWQSDLWVVPSSPLFAHGLLAVDAFM